ncbi:cytochrome P450 714A2-like [Carya illinoinensis]|uniref:cytochrome P450 714A2-like n=1 Tax=Carya illinoinensis TaxID=32201 RepID=UPI001C71EBC7|nr:cytochrome P450 714A2-like [Carya illinoinensis]
MIIKVVKQRMETTHEKDLLQMILEGAKNTGDLSDISPDKFIVDNCKLIYIGSYGTVAITASWSLMLLAAYPEWQARARAEVLEMCKRGLPDADTILNMKQVGVRCHPSNLGLSLGYNLCTSTTFFLISYLQITSSHGLYYIFIFLFYFVPCMV